MDYPNLCGRSVDMLEAIAEGGIVRGADLVQRLHCEPRELLHPTRTLLAHQMIEVSGDRTPDRIAFACFGVPPSCRPYVQELIRRHRFAEQATAHCTCKNGSCNR